MPVPRPFFASVVGYSSAVLSVAGLAAFCLVRIAYSIYYGHYGVSPDTIGLGFQALLAQEASAVNVSLLVVVIAMLMKAGWLINGSGHGGWRIEDEITKLEAEREFLLRSLASPASPSVESDRRTLVGVESRKRDLETELPEAQKFGQAMRKAGIRWVVAALIVFTIWAAALIVEASVSSGGARSAQWYDPLQIEVMQVKTLTFDDGLRASTKAALGDPGQILFLGLDDNDFVLYDLADGRVLFVPDDSVEMATR